MVIPVAFFIQANAELTGAQVRQAGLFTAGTLICSNILLLIWVHLFNHQARMMIGERLNGIQTPTSTKDEKLVAWKQITSAPWHYGIAILLVSIFIMILPLLGFMSLSLKASTNQLIYILMGSAVSASVTIAVGALILEHLLSPARAILLPEEFENQLAGSAGAGMLIKFGGKNVSMI